MFLLLIFWVYLVQAAVNGENKIVSPLIDFSLASEKLTIRVNTFKRIDLLKHFIEHYAKCSATVEEIQVVWSDVQEKPPYGWIKDFLASSRNTVKVAVEEHKNNSLSNRFRQLIPINTDAILTIDDDIIILCDDLHFLMQTWIVNQRVIVGISPRLHRYNAISGAMQYLNWQYAWWNGKYSIVLTKASIMHKKYLPFYDEMVPRELLTFIDEKRNCEDIAIAYVTTKLSNSAPVWASVTFYDIASSGISSKVATHFVKRSECLQIIEDYEQQLRKKELREREQKQVESNLVGRVEAVSSPVSFWSWRIGSQKVMRLSWWNSWSLLFYDTK